MASRALLSELPGYSKLQALAGTLRAASIDRLFAEDPHRASDFTLAAAGLKLDYSKHLLTRAALAGLLELARESRLQTDIESLFTFRKRAACNQIFEQFGFNWRFCKQPLDGICEQIIWADFCQLPLICKRKGRA